MSVNGFRARLEFGTPALGTFLNTPSPEVVESLGWAGVDFVVIDCEHSPIALTQVGDLIRAAEVSDVVPIVRVPYAVPQNIFQALDAGAAGVQVPQVHDAQTAERIVRASRYAPEGVRGLAPLRQSRGGRDFSESYFRKVNGDVLVTVQIESSGALENLDAILSVKGIDSVFVGVLDLSEALGVPAQTEHGDVRAAAQGIATKARDAGKHVGIATGSVDEARAWIDAGFSYATVGSDLSFIARCGREVADLSSRYRSPALTSSGSKSVADSEIV